MAEQIEAEAEIPAAASGWIQKNSRFNGSSLYLTASLGQARSRTSRSQGFGISICYPWTCLRQLQPLGEWCLVPLQMVAVSIAAGGVLLRQSSSDQSRQNCLSMEWSPPIC